MDSKLSVNKRPVKVRAVSIAAAVTLLGGGLAACGSDDEPADESAAAENEQVDEGNESEESNKSDDTEDPQDNSDENVEGDIPDWFHENFPLYPDSDIDGVQPMTMYGEMHLVTTLIRSVDDDTTSAWYSEEYNKNGWSAEDDGNRILAQKEEDGYEYSAEFSFHGGSSGSSIVQIKADRKE